MPIEQSNYQILQNYTIKMRNYILCLGILCIGFFSCKNDTPAEQQTVEAPASAAEAAPVTDKEIIEPTPTEAVEKEPKAKKEKKERKPVAKFSFTEKEYDFGMKEEGDVIKHNFAFTNTGKVPLIIKSAESTCGCTIPEWPKEPIAPGESGIIAATFDSKGKLGSQKKEITIRANTYPSKTKVALVGFIGTMAKKKKEKNEAPEAAKPTEIQKDSL